MANTALLEIEGECVTSAVIINGPGVEIQVVEGFDALGRHNDVSGLAVELPFVFEIPASDACAASVQLYFDQYLADPANIFPRSLSLIVADSGGNETMRWNFFEFAPESYAPGLEGIRFTMYQRLDPIGTTLPRRDIKLQRPVRTVRQQHRSIQRQTSRWRSMEPLLLGCIPQSLPNLIGLSRSCTTTSRAEHFGTGQRPWPRTARYL